MSIWTPRFLATNAFGLDISDRSFKYTMVKKGRFGTEVVAFGKGEFPEGVIVAGEVKDEKGAADSLKRVLIATNLPTHRVIMALPEEKGFLRRIELPAETEPDKTRSALELYVEEHVPLKVEEMIFDYERVSAREAIVSVFPREVIESYMNLARSAGFTVVGLEMEAHALLRAAVPPDEKRPVMVVDLGEMRTGFLIADQGVVASTATKTIGGAAMIEAIQRATGSSAQEATRLFYEKGLLPAQIEPAAPHPASDIFNALLPIMNTLCDEIAKYLTFWQTHRLSPVSIYLTGGVAHLAGLPEYLAYSLRIPVHRADPAAHLFALDIYIPPISRHDTLLWAAALGLAVRNL